MLKRRFFTITLLFTCIALVVFIKSPEVHAATTYNVTSSADSGPGSLRDAVNQAADGDTISLANLSGTITLTTGVITISNSITINGPGASVLGISGNSSSRVFRVNNTGAVVTINDLDIAFGRDSSQGGAIVNFGTLTIVRCGIHDNGVSAATGSGNGASGYAAQGGAIFNYGKMTLISDTITNNYVVGGNGTTGLDTAHPGGNGGSGLGGALADTGGSLIITLCNIYNNNATGGLAGNGVNGARGGTGGLAEGGAIEVSYGSVVSDRSQFHDNHIYGNTGGATLSAGVQGGDGGSVQGGGLYIQGVLAITPADTSSVVYNNTITPGNGGDGSPVGNTGTALDPQIYQQ